MHVLLAEHPAGDRPPHVFVIAAHDDGPTGGHSAPCFVVACGCTDQFPLRPVGPQEAVRAVVAVASHGQEAANGGPSSSTAADRVAAGFRGLADAQRAAQSESAASPPDLLDALQRSVDDARVHSAATNERLGLPGVADPIGATGSVTESPRTPSDPGVFELHPSGGGHSWRLRDQHGDEVAVGKLYDTRDEARAAVDAARGAMGAGGDAAQVVEVAS